MIEQYDDDRYPSDVVQIVLSHIIPTFAIIPDISLDAKAMGVHQRKLTFRQVLC